MSCRVMEPPLLGDSGSVDDDSDDGSDDGFDDDDGSDDGLDDDGSEDIAVGVLIEAPVRSVGTVAINREPSQTRSNQTQPTRTNHNHP